MLRKQSQSGFTLIEMIVSLALFSVVVTIAVGALLVLIASNRQLQNEQSVLSNLSFALDSMTREIRTGTNYYCSSRALHTQGAAGLKVFSSNPDNTNHTVMTPGVIADCRNGNASNRAFQGIAFDEGGRSVTDQAVNRRISYFYNSNDGKLYRKLSGSIPESIVSDGIYIANAEFFVTSTNKLFADGDVRQPKVTIFIEAYASRADADADPARERSHKIQTTVVQRTLDI